MYKLVLFFAMVVFLFTLQMIQFERQVAVQSLFHAKHALNRSVHAAAQQVDHQALSQGTLTIDPEAAKQTAWQYLQHNMLLDQHLTPHEGTFLQDKVEVLVFDIVNESEYPLTYTYSAFDYEVTVNAPAVIMIIRIIYPRTFSVLGPITWEIKGVSELTNM